MTPIYNKVDQQVGWLQHDSLLNESGNHIGFLQSENIFNIKNGKHCGSFQNGHFRDLHGNSFAFISGASKDPILPILAIPLIPPIPPIPSIPPIRPIPAIPSILGIPTFVWSLMTFEKFFS